MILDQVRAALLALYAIEREIGAGGMATVYLAEDLKHHRKVAVKVLRPELAATMGPERFLREIEVAARLQHPHILPLLDSGSARPPGDGAPAPGTGRAAEFLYYVMPYVQGESLRDRLARERELPVHDALRIVIEVADALAHAHEQGVVHRDIKPENIMLSGRHALVTDFGVAKAVSEATGALKLTSAGVALGTPTYMAPEQAAADPQLDQRVDVYALGVVAYELLAGRPPFTGHTAQEVLAAHMTRPPEPIRHFRGSVSPAVESVVLRCLEKHPADRWQTTAELVTQLEPLTTPSGGTTPAQTAAMPAMRRTRVPLTWVLVAAGLAVGVALWSRFTGRPTPVTLGHRTAVTLEPGLELDPALSPDGKLVAYAAGPLYATRIYVRQLDGGRTLQISPDSGGPMRSPAWSPDGSRIAFQTDSGIAVVPSLGGPPRLVAVSSGRPPLLSPAWWPDGKSLVFIHPDTLLRLDLERGTSTVLTSGKTLMHSPAVSSDGRWVAVVLRNPGFRYGNRDLGNLGPSDIAIMPASGGELKPILTGGGLNASPVWQPGHSTLFFISSRDGGRDIYSVDIDGRGNPKRPAVRLTTGLDAHGLSLAEGGSRIAYSVFQETVNVWSLPIPAGTAVSAERPTPFTNESQVIEIFSISPDGQWLAFDSNRDGHQHLFRRPVSGGPVQQLTSGAWDDFFPKYSPNGSELVYHSLRNDNRDLFLISASGGNPTPVATGPIEQLTPGWSPDGNHIVFAMGTTAIAGNLGIGVVDRTPAGWGETRIRASRAYRPAWSPDGAWLAYAASDGSNEVRLVRPEGDTASVLLAASRQDGATWRPNLLAWSADSRAVYIMCDTETGLAAIRYAPLGPGGTPRIVARFDDPSLQPTRYGFEIHGGQFYFTLGSRKADIWVADLENGP